MVCGRAIEATRVRFRRECMSLTAVGPDAAALPVPSGTRKLTAAVGPANRREAGMDGSAMRPEYGEGGS